MSYPNRIGGYVSKGDSEENCGLFGDAVGNFYKISLTRAQAIAPDETC
ncbi:MAG: hypothetical protein ACYT04_45240 [Nostoc sp.]